MPWLWVPLAQQAEDAFQQSCVGHGIPGAVRVDHLTTVKAEQPLLFSLTKDQRISHPDGLHR
jgi:hypothetical protein